MCKHSAMGMLGEVHAHELRLTTAGNEARALLGGIQCPCTHREWGNGLFDRGQYAPNHAHPLYHDHVGGIQARPGTLGLK